MSGHFDRPKSVLSGHIVKMHGKWPMSASYFALWAASCSQGDRLDLDILCAECANADLLAIFIWEGVACREC